MARIVFISILLLSPIFATGALGDSGSPANPELVFQYRGPHPGGWIGQHLEDFAILSDQSLAIAVSEGPGEYLLYQVSPDGRLMHRTFLCEGAGNTSVDRAVAAALLTTPAREAQPNSLAQREDVIVANSAGQVWRIAPTGEVVWFTAVGPDFGLVTSMRVLRDGSILLGGRGDSDGPRWCGYDAQVIKLRSDGQPVWQWHFDLPDTWTYVNQLIERDRGYLVLVGTSGPGAEMGSSSNACADFSDRQWFAWLGSTLPAIPSLSLPAHFLLRWIVSPCYRRDASLRLAWIISRGESFCDSSSTTGRALSSSGVSPSWRFPARRATLFRIQLLTCLSSRSACIYS